MIPVPLFVSPCSGPIDKIRLYRSIIRLYLDENRSQDPTVPYTSGFMANASPSILVHLLFVHIQEDIGFESTVYDIRIWPRTCYNNYIASRDCLGACECLIGCLGSSVLLAHDSTRVLRILLLEVVVVI